MNPGTAIYGPGGESSAYRYLLTRDLRPELLRSLPVVNRVAFIMLNPSTATAEVDDPTIRRCVGCARSLGADVLEVANLFALRATDPMELRACDDPIGPDNDRHIGELCARASTVICAWGAHGKFKLRGTAVLRKMRLFDVKAMALRLNKDGSPAHPLYLPSGLAPFQICAACEPKRRGE